jgi:hypothetical protein
MCISACTRCRRGTSLIETVVATVLLSVVLLIGATVARVTLVAQAHVDVVGSRRAGLTDALRTLTAHVMDADPAAGDLRLAQDTVLDVVHTIGTVTVCRLNADTLTTTAPNDTVPWSTNTPRLLVAGDAVRIWDEIVGTWSERAVIDARGASGACGDATRPWPDRASQRLILSAAIPNIRPGAVARVLMREKWSLVLGSDSRWSLSLATWDATRNRFGVPQPLLSPLAAPNASVGPGLVVRGLSATGAPLPAAALALARTVTITLRTAAHARYGSHADSVRINVTAH